MGCFCVLTELVSLPEAGQGGVQASALLLVGTELLQQLTHLLLTHVQQPLQGHLAWAHLLQNTVDNRGIFQLGLFQSLLALKRMEEKKGLFIWISQRYLCDLFPQVDDAEPVAEAREVLQLGAPLL